MISDKHFHTFRSRRKSKREVIEYIVINCKHLKMVSHLVNMLDLTQTENNTEVELIQENGNETNVEQFQHFWPMHSMVPTTTTIPPRPRKKITMCEKSFSNQIANQRLIAKSFLQNKQIGRANKKNLGEDIACIRNIIALLIVWINPIRLDSKLGKWKSNALYEWITFMWEKMIPRDPACYICLPGIFKKLDQLRVKENSAINLVLRYMEDGHLDDEMKSQFLQIDILECLQHHLL